MAGRVPWNALAIVVAGAFAGLGLFFGLRPSASPPPPPPPTESAVRQKAVAEAVAWVEGQRARMVKTCWEPSFAATPEPARVTLTFNLSFDEHGKEIGRGISDHRDAYRLDVSACVRGLPERASISPPGLGVSADVTITLPN